MDVVFGGVLVVGATDVVVVDVVFGGVLVVGATDVVVDGVVFVAVGGCTVVGALAVSGDVSVVDEVEDGAVGAVAGEVDFDIGAVAASVNCSASTSPVEVHPASIKPTAPVIPIMIHLLGRCDRCIFPSIRRPTDSCHTSIPVASNN